MRYFIAERNPRAARPCERWRVRDTTGRKGVVLYCRSGQKAMERADALNLLAPLMHRKG